MMHDGSKTTRRAPSLERLLKERPRSDLAEFHSFWDGQSAAPKTDEQLVAALVAKMADEESVRRRLKFLSKKLVDLLKFFLRDKAFTATREQVLSSRLFNYMSPYEVEAALNALMKRGFVFQLSEHDDHVSGETAFAIPSDLGEVLHAFLWDEECPLSELFRLASYARRLGEGDLDGLSKLLKEPRRLEDVDAAVAALSEPEQIAHRIEQLEPDVRAALHVMVVEGGGFVPKSHYDRVRGDAIRWDRRRFKRALEGLMLGSLRHLALGEYGINHFDDTVVIFEEVASVWRRLYTDPARELSDVRTCGVDLISDIANFLSFVAHNRIRLTLTGQIYRTVNKKLGEQFILSRKTELAGVDPFQYVYDFCIGQKLVQRRPDRSLLITVKGRIWDHEALEKKLRVLLDFAFRQPLKDGEGFHAPKLRERLLARLARLKVGEFRDLFELPFAARNDYLASLEAEHVRDAFQNRYQYAPTAVMRDALGLATALAHWLREQLYLLGLVDVGICGEQQKAIRLTPLGARALGQQVAADAAAAERPLIVNPDFEILLFPDQGDTYDLITRLDRFAERQASDSVYRYRVSASSIEKAVAEGVDVAEILRVLSEHARGTIPQNVVYSVKEWAGKVRFVSARKVMVLRGRNREIMDRVLRALATMALSAERLSPTAIMIEETIDLPWLNDALARDGVFLEGLMAGGGNGQAHGPAGSNGHGGHGGHGPHTNGVDKAPRPGPSQGPPEPGEPPGSREL